MNITVARGDGIGPEIMDSVLDIFNAANVPLKYDFIDIGEKIYLSGDTSGISKDAWNIINKNKVLLKGPITTPRGTGWKSLNVTLRKTLGLYANVRPVSSWSPIINNKNINLTIIRENEEDLYAGIEHRQTAEVTQCLKLITRSGCERIARYSFEYAKSQGLKKVTCMVKDNIMKITDGLFLEVCQSVSKEYPEIEFNSEIIDIGSARLATKPHNYEVIVAPNLYGDIISDIAAEVAGSVGIAPSYNIGDEYSMFEAIHGSAPDIAGKNIANSSALLLAGVHMLNHLGLSEYANTIQNAWTYTLSQGNMTKDLSGHMTTTEFTKNIIENIGKHPETNQSKFTGIKVKINKIKGIGNLKVDKKLKGVDVFVDSSLDVKDLASTLITMAGDMKLNMITNRGVIVYPKMNDATNCSDHWRCRFYGLNDKNITHKQIVNLLDRLVESHIDVIKTENLYYFNGKPGFSLGQGQ